MTNEILTDNNSGVKLQGIARGVYEANGQRYYGDNIATVTAQAVAEQSQPVADVDWYACECGRTVDNGQACPDCIAELDKPGQSACLINGRLDWLPTDEEMEQYFAQDLIEDDTIDIDDWMTAGLPQTNPNPVITAADWNRGEC